MSILPISGAENKGVSAVKKQPTLLRKFCISIVGAMLALTFFLVGTSMLLRYRYAQRDMVRLSQDYLAGQKSLIKGEVDQAIEVMDQLWLESDRQARRTVQFRVDEAWSIANHLYRCYRSSKSAAEIKRLIIAALRPIRYRQGQGYYFITRGDGLEVLFADHPEMEGRKLLSVQDTEGRFVVRDMISIAHEKGEGFYQYTWSRPGSKGSGFEKISYVKHFAPFDWIIGTGVYLDETRDQFQRLLADYAKKHRFGPERNGYIFIIRLHDIAGGPNFGSMYVNPNRPDLIGKELSDETPDARGKKFRQEFLLHLRQHGEGFVSYWYKKFAAADAVPKISFFKLTSDRHFIVAAGVYLDDLEKQSLALLASAKKELVSDLQLYLLPVMFLLLLYLFWFRGLYRQLANGIMLLTDFFSGAARRGELIDSRKLRFAELSVLAEHANQMLQDKQQAEQQLRSSESLFRSLVENAPTGIFLTDDHFQFIYANEQFSRLMGYSNNELLGMDFRQGLDSKSLELVTDRYQRRLRGEDVEPRYEILVVCKDGSRFPAEIIPTVFKGAEGETRMLAQIIDISAQKKQAAEKEKLLEELREARNLEALGTLAGGIAHDFNNLLTGVFGNISLAHRNLNADDPAAKQLDAAQRALERARSLTRQLLTFSLGGSPLLETQDIRQVITETASFNLAGSNVKLVTHFFPDTWNAKVDKGQISQVVANLVLNADQAMPDGGILEISTENVMVLEGEDEMPVPGAYVKIKFQDQGVGIPEAYQEKIFAPYFTTKQTGSGLGLATVYSIIRKHGGHIRVSSTSGQGTLFTLYLPAVEPEANGELQEDLLPLVSDAGFSIDWRVLVMDDEEVIREVAAEMLAILGCRAETANDGREAITCYREAMAAGKAFDLVIMDLTIPGGMGGEDAVREILKIDPRARVVVSSGYSEGLVVAHYRDYGFMGKISKPYSLDELQKLLEKFTAVR